MRARGLSVVGLVARRLVGVRAVEVPEVVERVLIRRGVLDGVRANIAGDFVAPGLGLDLVDARIAAAPVIFVKVEALLCAIPFGRTRRRRGP